MQVKHFFLVGLLTACGALAVVQAQPPGRVQRRMVLEALDLDRNGVLSALEIAQAAHSLTVLDRNGDGRLSLSELMPSRVDLASVNSDFVVKVMAFDKQGKGYVVAEDLPERMRGIFARADRNRDGKLTADELQMAGERQSSPEGGMNARENAVEFFRRDPLLMALDLNHDGEISADEIARAPQSLLALDSNHDGVLTPEEFPVHQMSAEERAHHVIDEFDGDKDGRISRTEAPEGMLKEFAQIDTNGDGYLDVHELAAFFARAERSNESVNAHPHQTGKE